MTIAQEVNSIRKGLQKTRSRNLEESTRGWELVGAGLKRLEEAVALFDRGIADEEETAEG